MERQSKGSRGLGAYCKGGQGPPRAVAPPKKNLSNKNQQNAHFSHYCFNLIIVSSTCFEQPRVHHQEDLYMQFYGISFTHLYKQSGRWQDVVDIYQIH